jgi:hypothetical protein
MNTKRVYAVPAGLGTTNAVSSSGMFRKHLYLYDANTLALIKKFASQRDLINELKISSHTVVKYQDSGLIVRGKYIISTKLMANGENEG